MAKSGKFKEKTILLLEKKTNDRTWCFWQIEKGDWEPSISKKWSSTVSKLDEPYQYNMVQGLDFTIKF
jgi:lycopene beta-cyclase